MIKAFKYSSNFTVSLTPDTTDSFCLSFKIVKMIKKQIKGKLYLRSQLFLPGNVAVLGEMLMKDLIFGKNSWLSESSKKCISDLLFSGPKQAF